nr:ubiquitin-conjugating enzyme E2 A [Cryptomonas sp.]
MKWSAIIIGPEYTPWCSQLYKLVLEFSGNYPNDPPTVTFCSRKIFHPNVYPNGKVCIDILGKMWSPVYSVQSILYSMQSLLNEPNPSSPANTKAAKMYINHRFEYFRIIGKLTPIKKHRKRKSKLIKIL